MADTTPPPQAPSTAASHPPPLIGGRYHLERRLASGGMAEVWEATDEVLARRVAIKALHRHLAADPSFVQRFRREAVAAARLAHPAIVSIFDTCSENGAEVIVMELVEGETLRQRLDRLGSLAPDQVVDIAVQVADALDYAHRVGVVHRDVKPGNILLSADGRVLVTDFGIAKAAHPFGDGEADLTRTGTLIGTAKYLAPEQVDGQPIDGRADVYALGVVLYELLSGRAPFEGQSDMATAIMRLHRDPLRPRQLRAGIPRRLEAIVLKAMARDPDHRFATAADLRTALLGLDVTRDRTAVVPRQPPPPATVEAKPSFTQTERSWLVPAMIVCLVALGLGVAGVLLGRTEVGQDLGRRVREAVGAEGRDPVPTVEARAFDPFGADGENDSRAPLAIDGNQATAWRTERYNQPDLPTKDGVGLVVRVDASRELERLEIVSPTSGWAARVYVADGLEPPGDLGGWGAPVGGERADLGAGETSFDLDNRRGTAVLLWITHMGDEGHTEIQEVRILA